MADNQGVLVFAEVSEGQILGVAKEGVAVGRTLANAVGGTVTARSTPLVRRHCAKAERMLLASAEIALAATQVMTVGMGNLQGEPLGGGTPTGPPPGG